VLGFEQGFSLEDNIGIHNVVSVDAQHMCDPIAYISGVSASYQCHHTLHLNIEGDEARD
jgi:hypothetical protein